MNDQGELNLPAFEHNVKFLIENGLSSIFVGCGSGEFHSLDHSEYRVMIEAAVSTADGRVPVYAGVGGNIRCALALAATAERSGAEGYLILPPYLIDAEQDGLYEYISAIARSTPLSAIVYQRDNGVLNLQTLQRLLSHPQIVGFKDGLGNMDLNIELTQTIGDRLEWLNGMPMAEVTMPAYVSLGFRSYSSAISNFIPHISALFYQALFNQNQELLQDLYRTVLLPINRIRRRKKGYAISLIKAGMEIVGLPVGLAVRPPLVAVADDDYKELEQIVRVAFARFPEGGNRE